MKKVLSVLLAVLCLTLLATTVSAAPGYPSFDENGVEVAAGTGTFVDGDYHNTGVAAVDSILAAPTTDKLATAVPGFPSTSSNTVEIVGGFFFDVTGATATTAVSFTAESDKIVSGVSVGVAHYSTTRGLWEFVKATSVDTTNHTATFNLADGSPVALIVYKAKSPAPAPSGVVNTATY